MKILIAPDSFKDALPALQVCEAIREGVLRALPRAEVQLFPLADGGEGTAEVLHWHLGRELVAVAASDPLLRPVEAQYFSQGKMAVVEMAQASGLQLLRTEERNPLKTSTFGTGELLWSAIMRGATEIYLTIGGSATNDAGMGMAAALGWQFLDENGALLAPIGENLAKVYSILPPKNPVGIPSGIQFKVLSDVQNPLFGLEGAAFVFGRQKGADAAAIAQLDNGLRHFSEVVASRLGKDFSAIPGAGAAGGLGFGALAFLGAEMLPGALTIFQLVGFDAVVGLADLVITGEGKLDGQTLNGKLVAAVCQKANAAGVPVVAFAGEVTATAAELEAMGLVGAYPLRTLGETVAEAITNTGNSLKKTAYKVLKIMQL